MSAPAPYQQMHPQIGTGFARMFTNTGDRVAGRRPASTGDLSTADLGRGCLMPMPSITRPLEPSFDPRRRPPTWDVPLGQVSGAAATPVVFWNGCQHRR